MICILQKKKLGVIAGFCTGIRLPYGDRRGMRTQKLPNFRVTPVYPIV